jgi:hypothetical protein
VQALSRVAGRPGARTGAQDGRWPALYQSSELGRYGLWQRGVRSRLRAAWNGQRAARVGRPHAGGARIGDSSLGFLAPSSGGTRLLRFRFGGRCDELTVGRETRGEVGDEEGAALPWRRKGWRVY